MMIRAVKTVIVVAAALGLAGCQVMESPSQPRDNASTSSWRLAIFGNPQNVPAQRKMEIEDRDLNCPPVGVLDGGASLRVARQGATPEVAHQASLIDTARECQFSGGNMTLKVGVQGRLLIGAAGKPGTYTVPVRVAVKRNEAVVASRFTRLSVTVPQGDSSAAFTHVEENIVLPVSVRDPGEEYDIFVGFDEGGGPADPRKGRRKR